jgi:Hydrogenase/urease accessory protein
MKRPGLIFLLLALLPATAFAHPGHGGFGAGVLHPFSGLDHLAAMFAVGLLAARLDRAQRWLPPVGFVVGGMIGAALGLFAGWSLPGLEWGLAASALVLGGALAWRRVQVSARGLMLIVLPWGVLHGNAHALEASGDALHFVAGFLVGTALLHAAGLFVGLRLQSGSQRALGVGIASIGAWLMWGLLA